MSYRDHIWALLFVAVTLVATFSSPQLAMAGGLDVPTLHTARHAGVAGAVTAAVGDPSAVLHNPAGLAHTRGFGAIAGSALFITNLQTSPDYAHQNISTGSKLALVPFAAAAYRISDDIAVGLGAYPVGAVGGDFRYVNNVDIATINQQQALLFEIAPAISVQLPGNVSLGLAYRVNVLSFRRLLGPATDPDKVDVDLFGANFTGVRVGAQWRASDLFEFGLTYRHRTEVTATADTGTLFGQPVTNLQSGLVMPGKISLGGRMSDGVLSVALDLDYIFNSQFQQITISGDLPSQGSQLNAPFLFRWHDSMTLKLGAESKVTEHWSVRAGYAIDGSPINASYPSTFSGPPTTAQFFSFGVEYRVGNHSFNLAMAHRYAPPVQLYAQSIASSDECAFCAKEGQYWSSATALFFDVATAFDP